MDGMKAFNVVIPIWLLDILNLYLDYCRAIGVNPAVISDFSAKLGAVCGCLYLFTYKPMQIFNLDETTATVVHKARKVISVVFRHHLYSLTSTERKAECTLCFRVLVHLTLQCPQLLFILKDGCSRELPRGCTRNPTVDSLVVCITWYMREKAKHKLVWLRGLTLSNETDTITTSDILL